MKTRRTLYSLLSFLFLLVLAEPATGQLHQDCTGNESWFSAGGGLSGKAFASTEMDGKLHVLHRYDPSDSTLFRISSWDGAAWSEVTSFSLVFVDRDAAQEQITGFQAYNGSIYMSGDFLIHNNDDSVYRFVRWDGSAWSFAGEVPGPHDIWTADALCVHNGNLIASATAAPNPDWAIRQWDGNSWSVISDGSIRQYSSGSISSMLSWNGDLYVAGEMHAANDDRPVVVARWNGTEWSAMEGNFRLGMGSHLFAYNNELYLLGPWLQLNGPRSMLARWTGTEWTSQVPQPNRRFFNASVTVHNGEAYMISASDSSLMTVENRSLRTVERFDGTAWHISSNFNETVAFLADYNGNLIAGGSFSSSCGVPLEHVGILCNDQNCAKITGTVYYDVDDNCTQDAGEKGLPRRLVTISPGPHYAATDKDGNYARFVQDGNYTVTLEPPGHWNRVCPADPGTHSVTVSGSTGADNIDFGAKPIPGIQDLRVSMVSGFARQGRQLVYVITYENAGTMMMNGTVRLFLDPILRFDSSVATHSRHFGNVVEWDFTKLQMDEMRTIKVYTTVPISTPINTNICCEVEIEPAIVAFNTDDRDSVCVPVTASYDPNDIQVTPFGIEENGVITPEDRTLTYWVRFQNTGNDTAFNVVVTDKLSANLDISSVRLGASSHPYSFSIDKDNMLQWSFKDIMLPDSGANQTNSNGFFKFSVNLKPNLPSDTRIPNFVDIYFDYNAPVRTNTVVSIIDALLGVDPLTSTSTLSIYPNPARSELHLSGELRNGSMVTLRNLLGQEVAKYRYDGSQRMTIDASALAAGTYLLEVETADGVVLERVSVVR